MEQDEALDPLDVRLFGSDAVVPQADGVSELCHLKVSDIDSARMTIRVEQGKGAKDRYTLLSPRLLRELRRYWVGQRPKAWLFCATRELDQPISITTAQKIFYAAKRRAGIGKDCGIHGLRHAFATHLLEAGVDIHTIQRLMGHGHISSTLRYFHLAHKHLAATTFAAGTAGASRHHARVRARACTRIRGRRMRQAGMPSRRWRTSCAATARAQPRPSA